MGYIYKITNKINNKFYIGKTKDSIQKRWKGHVYDMEHCRDNSLLHNAMRKYGIEHFQISIIEECDDSLLNEKEKYYIELFHSTKYDGNYNITTGGDGGIVNPIINQQIANQIIETIIQNPLQTLKEISQTFNISYDIVVSINRGATWYNKNYSYPIRSYTGVDKITIDREKYAQIINDIQSSETTLQTLATKYNVTVEQMRNINNGLYCYCKDGYYKGIYNGSFPIRSTTQPKTHILNVIYELLFINNNQQQVAKKFNMSASSLYYITGGRRHRAELKHFIFPIMKHIEENKQIFIEFYGGDVR